MPAASLTELILRTRIVTSEQVAACRQDTGAQSDDERLAESLVECGFLTAWQLQNIRAGHVNFLLDHGKYLILDQIGVGGMGAVYRARHLGMDADRAIKVIDPRRMADPLLVERFKREVQVSSRLDHENIVRAYDVGDQGGGLFLVLEYVAGADLSSIVRRNGPMAFDEAAAISLQAACGLAYAHGKGVVHRDIKPANILLSCTGVAKILDMGLARIVEEHDPSAQRELTRDGDVMGTVAYMPMEQARNARTADHRSDVYSLGATLYNLLTGHTPYDGRGHVEILSQLVTGQFTPIATHRADCPEGLQGVVHRMLAHRPVDRYQAASDVVRALTPFAAPHLAGRPVVSSSVQAVAEQVEATLILGQAAYAAQTEQLPQPGAPASSLVTSDTAEATGDPVGTEAFTIANQSLFSMADATYRRPKPASSKWIVIGTLIATGLVTAAFVAASVLRPGKPAVVHKPDIEGVSADVKNGPGPTNMRIRYDGHLAPIWAVAWSPDSTMVATGGVDATVLVWRGSNFQLRYDGHEAGVISVQWAQRAQLIVSVDILGNIDVWDSERGTLKRRFTRTSQVGARTEDEQSGLVGVGLHPRGIEVAANVGLHVQRWNVSDGSVIGEIEARCCQLVYSPSGRFLVGGSLQGELHVWELAEDGHAETVLQLPAIGRIRTFRFVGDERLAVVTETGIAFWEPGRSETVEEIVFPDGMRASDYEFIRVSGDGTKYLAAREDTVTLTYVQDGTSETFKSLNWAQQFRHAFTGKLDYVLAASNGAVAMRIRDRYHSLGVPGRGSANAGSMRLTAGRCLLIYNYADRNALWGGHLDPARSRTKKAMLHFLPRR